MGVDLAVFVPCRALARMRRCHTTKPHINYVALILSMLSRNALVSCICVCFCAHVLGGVARFVNERDFVSASIAVDLPLTSTVPLTSAADKYINEY